MFYIKYIFL